jgi:hypothetical protein
MRLFWTVSDPHQYPGPSTHGALAGAWFHGALCGAVARGWESVLPERLIGGRGVSVGRRPNGYRHTSAPAARADKRQQPREFDRPVSPVR